MAEKRFVERAPRIPLDVEVNCDGNKFVYSKNISESGIALISDIPFEMGQFLQLTFHLPVTSSEIKAYGKVVRTEPVSENFHEVGIQFWDIQDKDKQELQAFFREQEKYSMGVSLSG